MTCSEGEDDRALLNAVSVLNAEARAILQTLGEGAGTEPEPEEELDDVDELLLADGSPGAYRPPPPLALALLTRGVRLVAGLRRRIDARLRLGAVDTEETEERCPQRQLQLVMLARALGTQALCQQLQVPSSAVHLKAESYVAADGVVVTPDAVAGLYQPVWSGASTIPRSFALDSGLCSTVSSHPNVKAAQPARREWMDDLAARARDWLESRGLPLPTESLPTRPATAAGTSTSTPSCMRGQEPASDVAHPHVAEGEAARRRSLDLPMSWRGARQNHHAEQGRGEGHRSQSQSCLRQRNSASSRSLRLTDVAVSSTIVRAASDVRSSPRPWGKAPTQAGQEDSTAIRRNEAENDRIRARAHSAGSAAVPAQDAVRRAQLRIQAGGRHCESHGRGVQDSAAQRTRNDLLRRRDARLHEFMARQLQRGASNGHAVHACERLVLPPRPCPVPEPLPVNTATSSSPASA